MSYPKSYITPGDKRITMGETKDRISLLEFDYNSRKKERMESCNLCNQTQSVIVSRTDRYGFGVHAHLCMNCGLGFLSPRLSADEYASFYEDVYRPLLSAYYGRKIDQHTIQDEQLVYAEYVWELLGPQLLPGCSYSLLDIGGSTGVVAKYLRDKAASERDTSLVLTILDPSPRELHQANSSNIETIAGLVENFEPGNRTWDIVLLCQTVDHLLDVRSTFNKIRGLMSDQAWFFVDIVDWEFALLLKRNLEETVKVDHPFMLTRDTLHCFLSITGFRCVGEALSPSKHLIGCLCQKVPPGKPSWERMNAHAKRMFRLVRQIQAEHGSR